MNKHLQYVSFSTIGYGFFLVNKLSLQETPLITKRIANSLWGLFAIDTAELVLLRHSVECGLQLPRLESLKVLSIDTTRNKCVWNWAGE